MQVILIDNYDSFSYNLVELLTKEGHDIKVLRNSVSLNYLENLIGKDYKNFFLVLSPGPGTPKDAGNLLRILKKYQGLIPMLGICLGHQAMIENAGGKIIKSKEIVHGKSSEITLSNHPIFLGMGQNMIIGRYHSLQGSELPLSLKILAEYNHIPMIVEWKEKSMVGIQFHPESIMTPKGCTLINNVIKYLGVD